MPSLSSWISPTVVNDKSDMPPKVCRVCQRGHCDGCVETLGADGQTDCKCSFKGHPWRDADYYRLRQEREPRDLSHLCGMVNVHSDLL